MVHYLRNNNKTLVDIDSTKDDFSCTVLIKEYSEYLLSLDKEKMSDFIKDMDNVQEMRGFYFEFNQDEEIPIDVFIKSNLKELSEKWNLKYITD